MAFCFLQQLSDFLQWLTAFSNGFFDFLQRLSDFPRRLSTFQEIQKNLFMARSIRKIAIQALYFSPLAP
jgi:hypothetical protein